MASYSKMQPRPDSFIRIRLAQVNAIGPGKADLLQAIGETGSLAEAARTLKMSCRRAWGLVRAMNAAFRAPLVEPLKGGAAGWPDRADAVRHRRSRPLPAHGSARRTRHRPGDRGVQGSDRRPGTLRPAAQDRPALPVTDSIVQIPTFHLADFGRQLAVLT